MRARSDYAVASPTRPSIPCGTWIDRQLEWYPPPRCCPDRPPRSGVRPPSPRRTAPRIWNTHSAPSPPCARSSMRARGPNQFPPRRGLPRHGARSRPRVPSHCRFTSMMPVSRSCGTLRVPPGAQGRDDFASNAGGAGGMDRSVGQLSSKDRIPGYTPLSSAMSTFEIFAAVRAGGARSASPSSTWCRMCFS